MVKGSGNGWWEDECDPGARGIEYILQTSIASTRVWAAKCYRRSWQRFSTTLPLRKCKQTPRRTTIAQSLLFKAESKPVGQVNTPDGPALLMRCDRLGDGNPRRPNRRAPSGKFALPRSRLQGLSQTLPSRKPNPIMSRWTRAMLRDCFEGNGARLARPRSPRAAQTDSP